MINNGLKVKYLYYFLLQYYFYIILLLLLLIKFVIFITLNGMKNVYWYYDVFFLSVNMI